MVIFLSTILFDAYFSGTSRRTGTGKGRRFHGAAAILGVADKLEFYLFSIIISLHFHSSPRTQYVSVVSRTTSLKPTAL